MSRQPGAKKMVPGHTYVVSASGAPLSQAVREVWDYRELVYFLAWRDVRVRYKQAVFGVAWALLRPFLLAVVFSFIFGRVANIDTGDVPYPVFAYAGLLVWTFFSTALLSASDSLVTGSSLVTKTYFPRVAMPLAAILAQLPDLLIAMMLLLPVLALSGSGLAVELLALPLVIVVLVLVTFGISLWLAAVNVSYRDVKQAMPFVVQIWLFVTPVLYPADLVPPSLQVLYAVNPMVAAIEFARWSLFGTPMTSAVLAGTSSAVALAVLLFGLWYFRRAERSFADVI